MALNFFIKIDNREKELIKLLETKGYMITLENLDIGDIQILDITTKEILVVIERKTYGDLSASIKDGRYKEQKDRLIHSIKKNIRKIVLIEGNNMSDFTLPHNTFNSVIINTMIRDNIHIFISHSLNDTVAFIENIILQLPKYYEDLQKEIINGEVPVYNNDIACKTKKKENITTKICFRNMLSQIPGVSSKIADAFVLKYDNMETFINRTKELGGNESGIIKLIGDEKYGANSRKIGDKMGQKIYSYIFNKDIPVCLFSS